MRVRQTCPNQKGVISLRQGGDLDYTFILMECKTVYFLPVYIVSFLIENK